MSFEDKGSGNTVSVGENITLQGQILGNNNTVVLRGALQKSTIYINIHGDNNTCFIGMAICIKGLQVAFGSHIPAHKAELHVSDQFSIEPNGRFLLYTSGNSLKIGVNCMFSTNITVRCGESPHLIFDKNSGEFLDKSLGVVIGNHVWVGENTYITKSAHLPDESVVGACAVVTKKFLVPHVAVAGNPARVVRTDIQWMRNYGALHKDSIFKESYDAFHGQF